jgi:hypothetical protein
MRALTVKQPWAWAIFHAGKDIENRSWQNKHTTGTIAIHVAKSRLSVEVLPSGVPRPRPGELLTGVTIGVVDIVDVVDRHSSIWFSGPLGWVLKNPRLLAEPIRCRGNQRLWKVNPEIVRGIERQLSDERIGGS